MRIFFTFLAFIAFQLNAHSNEFEQVPVAYKGRIHPFDAYAKLWLYDIYHAQQIKKADRSRFQEKNAQEILWDLSFNGHARWDDAPLFWIHFANLKEALHLNPLQDRFSYNQLSHALQNSPELLSQLATYFFIQAYKDPQNRSGSEKIELKSLAPGLWIQFQNNDLTVVALPSDPLWNTLKPGQIVAENARDNLTNLKNELKNSSEEALSLIGLLRQFRQWNGIEENSAGSLLERLRESGSLLKMLPSRHSNEWFSIHALGLKVGNDPIGNFTPYPNEIFTELQKTYLKLRERPEDQELKNRLGILLKKGYETIAGTAFGKAYNKQILYPTSHQLAAESFYAHYPLTEITILAYLAALLLIGLHKTLHRGLLLKVGIGLMITAFCLHTFLLALRCYILARPPVSNMFETVIYVPWIAVGAGFVFCRIYKDTLILFASALASLALLILLQLTQINSSFENVQAVLDSQYWLIVHVLLVVGSYGIFILCGILGQIYLLLSLKNPSESPQMQTLAKATVQTMYLGVAMLIPGTILGGVWAAESWGRFWDWDPKESWAFISCCIYLLWIHAYTFKKIGNFGIAIGSVVGLLAISFTWYGVNYILGTGLHSYGFGSGGEWYYYFFILLELIFLTYVSSKKNSYCTGK